MSTVRQGNGVEGGVVAEYDVLIVGGGMVGASLACALGGHPLRVGMIESVPFGEPDQPSYDDRSIALAYGSQRIFAGMDLWQEIAPQAMPIRKIHVSDRGHFGAVRMDAADMGCAALGYVVENRILGEVFHRRLTGLSNLDIFCPARLLEFAIDDRLMHARVSVEGGERRLRTRLIVGADGGRSVVRDLAGITANRTGYGQTAIIANITPGRDHRCMAYERFTASGPLAMLPLSGNRCSMVWTVSEGDAQTVLGLSDAEFLASVQGQFGARLGILQKVGRRTAYPLTLISARQAVRERMVLIGNAAHTLHPVAGQGFNLGLRDVAALAEVLVEAVTAGRDPGAREVLDRYSAWRHGDQHRVTAMTDGLVRLFSNDLLPLVLARSAGLLVLDKLAPLKRLLMRQTMGTAGRQPRLARGLALGESL
jgi:2-octaprenyl-6-methoxyphenol hydroxylase